MRAILLVAASSVAYADVPVGDLHEAAREEDTGVAVDTSLRMRSEGTAAGVGVAAQLVRGDYTLSVGLTRWQTFDLINRSSSQGSWEAGVRVERRFGNIYLTGSLGYERVERDDMKLGRKNMSIGAGYRWKSGWVELTAERKTWDDVLPPGVTDQSEYTVMLMLGFTF